MASRMYHLHLICYKNLYWFWRSEYFFYPKSCAHKNTQIILKSIHSTLRLEHFIFNWYNTHLLFFILDQNSETRNCFAVLHRESDLCRSFVRALKVIKSLFMQHLSIDLSIYHIIKIINQCINSVARYIIFVCLRNWL